MPDFSQCEPIRVYKIGNHTALLVDKPLMLGRRLDDSIDPKFDIKFLFAMVVYEDKALKIIITSELTSNVVLDLAPEHIKEPLKKPSLCVFDGSGIHNNYGKDSDWSNIDIFCHKCFEIIRTDLNEVALPVPMQNISDIKQKPATVLSGKIKQWHFGKLILLWIIAIVSLSIIVQDLDMFGVMRLGNSYLAIAPTLLIVYSIFIIYSTWIWISALENKSNK
jgi:hypothetical protein